MHFVGVLIGGSVTGQLADLVGRRPVSILSLLLMSALGMGISFTWNYELLVVLRLLMGIVIPVRARLVLWSPGTIRPSPRRESEC